MKKIKILVLDFDGVVVESNGIKDKAFEEIFKEYPKHFEHMMQYHMNRNATDRYEKFRYFVEDILQEGSSLKKQFSDKFNDLTMKAITTCDEVKGARDFLEYFRKKLPLYLASATPQKELEKILNKRNLSKYFLKVFGSSKKKVTILKDLIAQHRIDSDELVFIGDSPEDALSAQKAEVSFVGRKSDRNLKSDQFQVFKDMEEVKQYLCSLNI